MTTSTDRIPMGEERRKNRRYPPTAGSEAVVLRHGGVDRAANLVNFSAEGFRLRMDVEADIESVVAVGDGAILTTDHGRHQVRVANVHSDNGTLLIGLQRLGELPGSEVHARRESAHGGRDTFKGRRSKSPFFLPLIEGVVFVAVVTVALIVFHVTQMTRDKSVETVPAGRPRIAHTRNGQSYAAASSRHLNPAPSNEVSRNVKRNAHASPVIESRAAVSEIPSLHQDLLFDPNSDAVFNISVALKTATRENKRVLVEFGANECDSCYQLHHVFTKNAEIATTFDKAFILVPVNINTNQKLFARFVPDEVRPRIPFLTLLDKDGKVLRNQRTNELEDGSKLDLGKVKAFLQQSSPST